VQFSITSAKVIGTLGFPISFTKAREAEREAVREARQKRFRMDPLPPHGEAKAGEAMAMAMDETPLPPPPPPTVGGYYEDENAQSTLFFKIVEPERQVEATLSVFRSGNFQFSGKGLQDRGNIKAVLERAFPALCRYRKER